MGYDLEWNIIWTGECIIWKTKWNKNQNLLLVDDCSAKLTSYLSRYLV